MGTDRLKYVVATQLYQIFYQIIPKSYLAFNYVKKKWINKVPGNSEAEKVIFILGNHRMLHGGGGLLSFNLVTLYPNEIDHAHS